MQPGLEPFRSAMEAIQRTGQTHRRRQQRTLHHPPRWDGTDEANK